MGANEVGDVREAALLRKAVEGIGGGARRAADEGRGAPPEATTSASTMKASAGHEGKDDEVDDASAGPSIKVHVWPGRDHNVVTSLRDDGTLHSLLQQHCLAST